MKRFINYLIVVILLFSSCGRTDKIIEDKAGKGGNATLLVTPQHHGKNIDSCTIYIKYNTLDAPTTAYDDSAICTMSNGKPIASFSGLRKGDYYLYGEGYDPAILQQVAGGINHTIKEEKTIQIFIPVTEDH